MEIDIRKNIINNFANESKDNIINSINEAITSKDELVLPGLGVFLEIVWKEYTKEEQNKFAEIITKKMNI